jgi:hypothetical protein
MSNDKKIKRWTNSRKIILNYLLDDEEGLTASDIYYLSGICLTQIYKTLKVFVADGLVTYEMKVSHDVNNKERLQRCYKAIKEVVDVVIPDRTLRFPEAIVEPRIIMSEADRQRFILNNEINDTLLTVSTLGRFQINLVALTKKIKVLIQKTHTDKVSGFESQNVNLIKALKTVRVAEANSLATSNKVYIAGWGYVSQEEYELIMMLSNYYSGVSGAKEALKSRVRTF